MTQSTTPHKTMSRLCLEYIISAAALIISGAMLIHAMNMTAHVLEHIPH